MIDGDVHIAAAGMPSAILIGTQHRDPVEAGSIVDLDIPSASTASLAVYHDTSRASANRAIVR